MKKAWLVIFAAAFLGNASSALAENFDFTILGLYQSSYQTEFGKVNGVIYGLKDTSTPGGVTSSPIDVQVASAPFGQLPIDFGSGFGEFNVQDNVITSFNYAYGGSNFSSAGLALGESASVFFVSGETGYYNLIGNVTFTPAAAPEPTTWTMMITGLALAGGAFRLRPRRFGANVFAAQAAVC